MIVVARRDEDESFERNEIETKRDFSATIRIAVMILFIYISSDPLKLVSYSFFRVHVQEEMHGPLYLDNQNDSLVVDTVQFHGAE